MTAEVRTTGVITGLSSKLTRRARGVGDFQGVRGFHGVQNLSVVCVYRGVRGEEVLPVFPLRQALPCLLQ